MGSKVLGGVRIAFLAVAFGVSALVLASLVAGAHAAPGNPGVPGAPAVVFEEDFENVPNPAAAQLVADYTGAPPAAMTYTAHPSWLNSAACNGVISSWNATATAGSCPSGVYNAFIRPIARGMGAHLGGGDDNQVMSDVTISGFPAPATPAATLETESPVALPSANRFVTFSIDAGAVTCNGAQPLLRFFLLDGNNAIPITNNATNACTDPRGTTVSGVRVGSYASDDSILFSGSQLGVRLTNDQTSGSGNDYAVDNLRVLDATPQLDKEFGAPTPRGVPTTLTFTITNTSELAAKEGWSFTDNLPAGLEVASPAGASTTCTNGAVTAAAGGTTVEVEGDLEANRAACTTTVQVVADEPGEYENCAQNLTDVVGLDLPNCDTLSVLPAADLAIIKSADAGPHAAGQNVTYTLTVGNNGPNAAENVEVHDDLPPSLTFVSATAEQGSCSQSDPVDCDLGTITNGDSVDIEVVAAIDATAGGDPISNTATVDSDTADTQPDNNADDETIAAEPESGLSYFAKEGFDPQTSSTAISNGPAGTTAGGNVIDWVLSYRNQAGAAANVSITDPITGNHDYVSGSLRTPPGLAPQWSTDGGMSYVASEPAMGVNAVGANGMSVPGSTGRQVAANPPPPSAVPAPGGGDGFEPLFVGNNVYNVYHHRGGTSGGNPITVLDCHVKATGVRCPGYPTHVSPNAGDAFGTGPSTLTTALFTQAAVRGSRIYYPVGVIGSTSEGIVCADVATRESCGYTSLGTSVGNNPNNGSASINGGAVVGSRYYTVGQRGNIYCFDLVSETQCASIPITVSDPGAPVNNQLSYPNYNLQAWDDRYLFGSFARIVPNQHRRDLICIDLATTPASSCPGFPEVSYAPVGGANLHNTALAPILDSSGDVTGVCGVAGANTSEHPFECFDLNGNAVPTPFSETQTTGTGVNWVNFGSVGVVGSRLYFAESPPTGQATYTCWDYSVTPSAPGKIGNVCPGFVPASTGADVRAYAIRQDPQNPECMWQLGDRNRFEVFSATFGGTGCRFGNAVVDFEPEDFYCDGAEGHVNGWDVIRLGGLTSADYDGLSVTITDASGNPVPGWQNRTVSNASQTIDISSIPYAGSSTELTVAVAISWGNHPVKPVTVTATFDGDPPQVCFQTRVGQDDCDTAGQIGNDANAVTNAGVGNADGPAGNDTGPVIFEQPADPSACRTDLELTKSAAEQIVSPGGAMTWTLTVTNNGPNASTGSTLTEALPAGVSNIATQDPRCEIDGGMITCDVGPLGPDESTDIVVTGNAPQASAECFENAASVESNEPDPDDANNEASVRACTTPVADLAIFKSATPALVSQGGQVTYTLTVQNNGPDTATGVTVTDTLPDGLTNIQAPGCQVQGSTVTCEIGGMGAPTEVNIQITANAPNTPSTCFDNVASVAGDQGDPDLSDNESDLVRTCTTPAADLEIEKSGPAEVNPGGEITYTLAVSNDGPDDATNVVVTDELPAGLTNIEALPPSCSVQGQTVTCNFGTVPSGGSAPPIQITATAPQTASTCFSNIASVDGSEGDPDGSDNDSDPVRTCTRESDLSLEKTAASDLVNPGGAMSWTITVTNNGPDRSPGSTVTDTLPPNVADVTTQDPRCTVHDNEVTCNIGALNDDESTDIVITGTAPEEPSTCFENAASVEGTGDLDPENDDDTVRACTTPVANLELSKTAPAVVDPGGQVTWTLTVTNLGPDPSTGYQIADTLPAGMTNIQAPGCTVQGQLVTCDVDEDLAVDGSAEIVITGNAPNSASTCFENAAALEGDEDDPDLADNEASAETCTNEGADLQINKVASEGPFAAGDQVSYTLNVTNNGPATAHDVSVTDDLPDSLTLVSASPQADCTQSDPVTCTIGTLAPDASAEVTIVATIDEGQSGNAIENTACVEGEEPDSFEANDCDTEPVGVEPEADLSIVKTVDPKGPVRVGELLTYTLVVINNGPNEVNNANIRDDFNRDVEVVSATPSQGSCATTEPIECQLGNMAVNAQVAITVRARPLHVGRLVNDARVGSESPDSDPSNNEDDASVRIAPAKLEIKKRANRQKAQVGDVITYGIVVRSRTAVPLRGVKVCDRVPKALDLIAAPGAKIGGNKACWRFDLRPRAQRTFKVKARVQPTKYDLKVVNTAKVKGGDVAPAGDKDKVGVKGEPPTGPEPCPGRATRLRC